MSIEIPKCNLTKQTTVAAVVEQWRAVPAFGELLGEFEEFARQVEAGDELWWYRLGAWTGLAVVRREKVGTEVPVVAGYFPVANAYGMPVRVRISWGKDLTSPQILTLREAVGAFYDQPISVVRLILESRGFWEVVVDTEDDAKMMEETCRGVGLTVVRV
jgi:hypothetical protein